MTTIAAPNYAPVAPKDRQPPLQIADDTYVIRSLWGEDDAPVKVYFNSLVITGKEPIIVDTGTLATRETWLEDVFSIVDPKDVRWIFLSHDDHDHVGNLVPVLEMCANATLVSHWFQVERLLGDYRLPLDRMRWVNDGEAFDAGDRLLVAIRPPVFDSPTTRGLYDSKSRVYWAGDAFSAPVLQATDNANELDREFFEEGFTMFQSMISPWHGLADSVKFNQQVDRVAELDLRAIADGHGPVLTGQRLTDAIALMRGLPDHAVVPYPGQETLDAILQASAAA